MIEGTRREGPLQHAGGDRSSSTSSSRNNEGLGFTLALLGEVAIRQSTAAGAEVGEALGDRVGSAVAVTVGTAERAAAAFGTSGVFGSVRGALASKGSAGQHGRNGEGDDRGELHCCEFGGGFKVSVLNGGLSFEVEQRRID